MPRCSAVFFFNDTSSSEIDSLSPPSGRTVSYPMRFETNRHDATSCTGLTVMTDRPCVYCTSPRRHDGPSIIYCASRQTVATRCPALGSLSRRIVLEYIIPRLAVMTRCPVVAHRHDGSSLRIEYLALPSGRNIMTRCPALGSPS